MAVSILSMPAFRSPGNQGYNFAPVAAGLDSIRQQKNQNALLALKEDQMAMQEDQFEAGQQRQNALLEMQRQKLAQGPERPWWARPDGSVDPAMLAKTQAGRASTNVNVNQKAETAYDQEIGKARAKAYMEGQTGAKSAHRDMNNLRVMEQAIQDPNLYTGTGAKTIHSLKKAASSLFGVNMAGVQSGEVVENLSKQIAVGLKDNLPGPLSDSDRRFLVEMAPGLSGTPEGNRRIIALGMLQKQYQIARARAASQYASANGNRLDQGFDQHMATIEDSFAQQFSELIGRMSQNQAPQRPPTVGIPVGELQKLYTLEK